MRVDDDQVITVHYKMSNLAGDVLDSSQSEGPLVYLHNRGLMLQAIEAELTGHVAGDVFSVTLSPDDAYGPVFPELQQEVPRHAFSGQDITVGLRFKAKGENDAEQLITIKEIRANTVLVDANHPLAGETLVFDLAVVSVREPTEEELHSGVVAPQDGASPET